MFQLNILTDLKHHGEKILVNTTYNFSLVQEYKILMLRNCLAINLQHRFYLLDKIDTFYFNKPLLMTGKDHEDYQKSG